MHALYEPPLQIQLSCFVLTWLFHGTSGSKMPKSGQLIYNLQSFPVNPATDQSITIYMGIVTSRLATAVNIRWNFSTTAPALVPAIYQGILDARTMYNVNFIPKLGVYDDCSNYIGDGVTASQTWSAFQQTINLLLGSQNPVSGQLIVGPACTNDFLQVWNIQRLYRTNQGSLIAHWYHALRERLISAEKTEAREVQSLYKVVYLQNTWRLSFSMNKRA